MDRLLSIAATLEHIPVARSTLHGLLTSGELRSVKIGGRRFVPESAISEYLDRLQQQEAS